MGAFVEAVVVVSRKATRRNAHLKTTMTRLAPARSPKAMKTKRTQRLFFPRLQTDDDDNPFIAVSPNVLSRTSQPLTSVAQPQW